MSSYRAGQPKSETRKPVREGLGLPTKLSLLAAGSLLPLVFAPAANAQCTAVDGANQPVALNALTSDSVVTCSGVTSNESVSVSPPVSGVNVLIQNGTSVSDSTFNLNGDNHWIGSAIGTTFTDVGFSVNGANGQIFLQGNGQGVAALSNGTDTLISLLGGGTWNDGIVRATGANAIIEIGSNTTVANSGPSLGVGVLSGGVDSNVYSVNGNLVARADGLLITDDGGNDTYYINQGSSFSAAGGALATILDQGGAGDLLVISGTHNLLLDITGIDVLNYVGSNVDLLTLGGVGNLQAVGVQTGRIDNIDIGSLMVAAGTIDIGADGYMRYARSVGAPAFSQSLLGSGVFELDGQFQVTGDNSAFSGELRLSGSTFFGANQNAAGTADIVNNGNLLLGAVTLANQISGGGQIIMQGMGVNSRSILSGDNTYTGGTLIANAGSTLLLTNANAAGTGQVEAQADTFLELDFGTAGGDFANFVTGDGSLRKVGTGTLTVSNAGNDYTGGTQIDAGILRITDFAALGSGAVVANAGGALMYDYAGALNELFTAPLMTGDGQFIKAGSGTIVIDNANTWTGGTQILGGRVGLNNGQGLGTGDINVAQGAALGIGGVTLANNVTGAGQIVKTASNTAILTGVNTNTGGIVIEDGAIEVASGEALGGGVVDVQAGASLLVVNTVDTTVGQQLQGLGSFVKNGAGRAELTGLNGLGGLVAVNGGTLAVGSTANIGSAGIQVASGATLEIARSVGNGSFINDITGDGRLIKTGTSRVTLEGNNTYTGGTHILGGSLRVADLARLGTGSILVDLNAALDLDITTDATFNHALSGAGMLRKSGAGNLLLLSNSLSGGLDITQGNVTVNTIAALGVGPVATSQGASLTIDNSTTEVSSVLISGDGQLIKDGQGDLIIQNANTYTGGTIINAGRVGLNNGQGLGTGGVLINADGTLSLGGVSIANNISGTGSVLKTASNIGTLSGINTYSGGTVVQGGTLRVTGGHALGTGSVSLAAGTLLEVDNALNSTLINLVQGDGGLHKSGVGILTINTANTFTGGAFINAGAIVANHADALGTGDVTVASGAALGVGDVVMANTITGAGGVVKVGAGVGELTGTNTYSGGTGVAEGLLRVADVSAIGTGGVSISSGATFELANASALTFSHALSGPGTFRKTGAGDLTFVNAFSVGTLLVDAGRVRLNSVMTGNATVGANGILNGVGQVTGTLTNNGTVAPGNSIGTLNVLGNYVHNANSVLEIEFDALGGIDLLNVSGTAQLNGGTLRFVSLGGAEGTGGTFLIANGGVSGTFANIETIGAQLPLAVIYQPNAAIMAPSVLSARPSTFNSQALAASDTVMGFVDTVSAQALRQGQGNGAWAEAFTGNASRNAAGQTLGYNHDASGISVGVRGPLSDRFDAGVSLGWSQADISLDTNGGGGQQDGMLASVFGRYHFDGASIGAGVLYGSIDQSTARNVSFNTFFESVAGDTDSVVTGAFLSGDVAFGESAGWTFGGTAQASYLSQVQDTYTETGTSPLRLELPELTFETMGLEAGINAGTAFDLGGSAASIRFDVGVSHTASLDDRIIPVTFAASSASIDLQGDTRDHTSPFAGASFEWALGNSTSLTAGYHGRFGDDERHEARVGLQVSF
jgi:autotransporter-associated beta strand protein